jgi:hypothetical protein
MSRSLPLMFCLVIGLMVAACSKQADTNRAAATNSAAPVSTPHAATTPATTAAAEKVGVPECDAFLTAYENCVTTKVPEAQRATFQTGMKTWRAQWKKLADNPQTKAGLVEACKKQQELQRTTLNKTYGCTL